MAATLALLARFETDKAFDHDSFCLTAWEIVQRTNEERGKWIAEHTRHEGMTVDCQKRTVELKLLLHSPFKDIPGNWRDRTNFRWNEDYCSDPGWEAAINNQWTITLTVMSANEEIASFRADCH